MQNIIQAEDDVKGMPDQALQQMAQRPDGRYPQFLVVSEIQRRSNMRKRFESQQQPQGTVKDQIVQQGIAVWHLHRLRCSRLWVCLNRCLNKCLKERLCLLKCHLKACTLAVL